MVAGHTQAAVARHGRRVPTEHRGRVAPRRYDEQLNVLRAVLIDLDDQPVAAQPPVPHRATNLYAQRGVEGGIPDSPVDQVVMVGLQLRGRDGRPVGLRYLDVGVIPRHRQAPR